MAVSVIVPPPLMLPPPSLTLSHCDDSRGVCSAVAYVVEGFQHTEQEQSFIQVFLECKDRGG